MSNRNGPSIDHRQLGQTTLRQAGIVTTSMRKSIDVLVAVDELSRNSLIMRINEFMALPNDDKQFSIRRGLLPNLQCGDGLGLLVIPASVLNIDDGRMTIVMGTVPVLDHEESAYRDSGSRFVLALADDRGIVTLDA